MARSLIIQVKELAIGYKAISIREGINLNIYAGELVCIIGTNGCGKSTLIKTLGGLQMPLAGSILLNGSPIESYGRSISRELSVVLTERITIATLNVFEVVALGRYPYTNWMGKLTEQDQEIIHSSLQKVGMFYARNCPIGELSDGEQQRVMLAKALAQDTPVVLLDEPTSHLDLPNRVAMMHLLQKLAHDTNKCIVLSTHELDLALQVSDIIWLMSDKQTIEVGTPEDLVLSGVFEKAFAQNELYFDQGIGMFKIAHRKVNQQVVLSGSGVELNWTKKALEREGYGVLAFRDHSKCFCEIQVLSSMEWTIKSENYPMKTCFSINELLQSLRAIAS